MKRFPPIFLVALATLACGGGAATLACGDRAAAPPDRVAKEFWQGVERGDPELACRPLPDGAEASEVSFGETLENEASALVTTSLTRRSADGELRVTFYTHLTRADHDWQVDCDATRAELQKSVVVGSMREFGDALGRGARELGEALDQGVREMDRALREALEGEAP
jgi:hypothetical protein